MLTGALTILALAGCGATDSTAAQEKWETLENQSTVETEIAQETRETQPEFMEREFTVASRRRFFLPGGTGGTLPGQNRIPGIIGSIQ